MSSQPEVTIYIDGACEPNPGHMGAGAVLLSGAHRKESQWYLGEGTNQIAEIQSAVYALRSLRKPCTVTVYSDSQYLVRTMRGEYRRKANLEHWAELDAAVADHEVTWEWVKGHNGNPDNERANLLAERAAGMRP